MDVLNKEQRHRCMSSIRSKDTSPEIIVRRFLFARGFRYRLNCKSLPGHPDLVLKKYHTVIFVNGCFWHGHKDCKYFRLPKTNTEFWAGKIQSNRERDTREQHILGSLGWHCITIWECQLKSKERERTLESLVTELEELYCQSLSTENGK